MGSNMDRSNVELLLEALRRNNSSGANELVKEALEIIKVRLDLIEDPNMDITEEIHLLLKRIIDTRPTMAPLINVVGFLLNNLTIITKKSFENRIRQLKKERLEKNYAHII
jgi:translation initiation factor 2B subunit (eIF-2B alpha/beta/delta family)